uniref:Uncharacterized protein n=1 Tax=Auxenochlorella protothecoides TaxID=3075 RepID=A0A1D2A4E2_AUXPR
MNPQTALRGAMQRGEPIMFRITIDRLREDRRQTNHAKSQLALAFCQAPPAQAHAFALALVAECCAVGDCDESMIMCAQWALETLGKRAGADGDADGEGVGEARESLRGEALRSFLCCCADGQLKLALRVGTLFRLDLQAEMTAEERGGMARRLAEACAANAAAAGAVALLRRWPCLQLGEAVPGVLLPRLVAQGLSSLAISWAEELDGDVQVVSFLGGVMSGKGGHGRGASDGGRPCSGPFTVGTPHGPRSTPFLAPVMPLPGPPPTWPDPGAACVHSAQPPALRPGPGQRVPHGRGGPGDAGSGAGGAPAGLRRLGPGPAAHGRRRRAAAPRAGRHGAGRRGRAGAGDRGGAGPGAGGRRGVARGGGRARGAPPPAGPPRHGGALRGRRGRAGPRARLAGGLGGPRRARRAGRRRRGR